MRPNSTTWVAVIAVALAGCVSVPTGPRVAVMPAQGKPFEVFAAEEQLCRRYAGESIGITADEAAGRNLAGAAATGALIGAAAGALAGGSKGAGTGAAVGLVTGSAVGSGQSAYASGDAQRRYDIAYMQCMYAKGNQVPGYPAPSYVPPPPPGAVPPPPPPARP